MKHKLKPKGPVFFAVIPNAERRDLSISRFVEDFSPSLGMTCMSNQFKTTDGHGWTQIIGVYPCPSVVFSFKNLLRVLRESFVFFVVKTFGSRMPAQGGHDIRVAA